MSETTPQASSIALHLGAELTGADRPVEWIAPLRLASAGHLSFVGDPTLYGDALTAALEAGAVVLFPINESAPDVRRGAVIPVDNPRGAFAAAVAEFFDPKVEPGVAATAVVHPSASISPSAHVGEYTVIGPKAVIGANVEIRNHVVIGARVRIGDHSLIKSHAVIGEEGFGIDKDKNGNNIRLPHLGSVVIGAHVEIGNGTTVCSGTIEPSTVGDYTKVDDHVHVAHNCQIGRNVIITACAELSGSVTVGDDVWIGPNASIIQGMTIGSRSLIGIGAVVTKPIPEAEVRFGNPAKRIRDNT